MRFTTSHPRHFSRDIVEAIDSIETLCPHVHLPVQSGSSRLLSLMLREYTREQYLERIAWIKAARREISITTDVIVGFPGETNVDFEQTITLIEEVGYDGIFSFKYSPRPNTPSLKYPDSIPDDGKASRLAILQERQKHIQIQSNRRHLGEIAEVMVEGYNPARNQWIGRTAHNKTLNFTANGSAPGVGGYCNVRVTATFPNSLVGEMVEALWSPPQVRAGSNPLPILQ